MALRKAKGLLEAGAEVRIISPHLTEGLMEYMREGKLEWFERGFAEGDLHGAFLVFAATDSRKVQNSVREEAQRCGILLNSADDPGGSVFHVPAHFRRGQMMVTVATGGGSPALSRELRQQLEKIIVPEYEEVVGLLTLIREKVVKLESDSDIHGKIFRQLLQLGLAEKVLQRDWFEVQMILLAELPSEIDGVGLLKKFLEKYDHS